MAAAFRFSAQPEPLNSENLKGKPPDPLASIKRARSNDSDEDDRGTTSGSGDREPYGPWMQVTYGRNGRYVGAGHTGKKSNSQVHNGKSGSGRQNGSEVLTNVANTPRQSKELGKNVADISTKAMTNSRNGIVNNIGASVLNGSRFAVLSEETEADINALSTRGRVGNRGKTPIPTVLAEISNRKSFSKHHQSSGPNKYLV
ncbi:hypothetical protein Q3G72_033397 [Acer saccharum]|nr:hypothetical protein Q3G72_033397 [Acer saccharum]